MSDRKRIIKEFAGQPDALPAKAAAGGNGRPKPGVNGAAKGEPTPGQAKPAAAPPVPFWITLPDLLKLETPPTAFTVGNLIPVGLTVLAGSPKCGKSFLATQVAVGVASGAQVLGRESAAGNVLVVALEDHVHRLKTRTTKQLSAKGATASERCAFAVGLPRIDQGGFDKLNQWADSVPDPRLVIVDTFARMRSRRVTGKGSYDDDYAEMSEMQGWALARELSVLPIVHTRKADDKDPFATISGTFGIVAAADSMLVLERDGVGASLFARGRDAADQTLTLAWDVETLTWRAESQADGIQREGRGGGEAADALMPQCVEWLKALLAGGEQYLGKILGDAKSHDPKFSTGTVYNASRFLKIVESTKPSGRAGQPPKVWSLPAEAAIPSSFKSPKGVGPESIPIPANGQEARHIGQEVFEEADEEIPP